METSAAVADVREFLKEARVNRGHLHKNMTH